MWGFNLRRLAGAACLVLGLAGWTPSAFGQTLQAPRAPAPVPTLEAGPQAGSSLIIDQNRADRRPPAPAPTTPSPQQGRTLAVAEAQSITPFVLREVRIEGAHAPASILGAASRDYIGKTVDAAALSKIADAVALAYDGTDVALYTVVLPQQDFAGGVLRLRVVEGYVQTARVDTKPGAHRATRDEIRLATAYIRPLLQQKPLRKHSLQRAILLTRDMAGISAEVQILQAKGLGAVALVVTLSKKPIQVGVGVNNRGTAELGRTQAEIDVTINGLFRAGDQTRATVVVPTDIDRFQYYAISHTQLLNSDGLSLTGAFGYLRTQPLSFPIKGRAQTVSAALSYPLIRSNEDNLVVTGSLDGVDSTNALFGQTISNERTRSLRAAAAFSRAHGKSVFAASGSLSFGLDGLGARTADPRLGVVDYKKINLRLGYDRQISPRWVVRLRAIGQYSGDRLPASEQMTLGGDEFGRAFVSAAVVGDRGLAGSAEVGFLPTHLPTFAKGSELYAYMDAGKVYYRDRVIVPKQDLSLASLGVGIRMAILSKTVVQLEAAKPIHTDFVRYKDDFRIVASVRSLY